MSQYVTMDVTIKTTLKVEVESDDVDTTSLTSDIIDEFDQSLTEAFSNLVGWTDHEEILIDCETVDGDPTETEVKIVEIVDGPNVQVGGVVELV